MDMASEGDRIVDEFLGGGPRADEWADLAKALRDRLKDAISARDSAVGAKRRQLDVRVLEIEEQVLALEQEAAISRFVEDSVLATIARDPFERDWGDQTDR